ncbi:MAG: AraC family ligand binding domain-containing protein [Porticoccaceae bacterium]|nr:AraC family ligand binding domain-containing protein [Porticoccaceae bacterium]
MHFSQHVLTQDLYPLGLGYYAAALGHAMTREFHDDHLLIYCVKGRGLLKVGPRRGYLKAGQLVLLPRGLAHNYASDAADPWTI